MRSWAPKKPTNWFRRELSPTPTTAGGLPASAQLLAAGMLLGVLTASGLYGRVGR